MSFIKLNHLWLNLQQRPNWLSHMNLLTIVIENNGLQLKLVAVTSLRFILLHPLSWFFLVPIATNNLTLSSMSSTCSVSKLAIWSLHGITSGEVLTDTEPTGGGGVASTSTRCDTSLIFVLSSCWETVDFISEVSSNVTYWLNTIFLFSGSHNL